MEKDIANWKNLWKEEKSTPLDVSKLINLLNKIERKGKVERIILAITILITLVLLVTLLPVFSNKYYFASIVLIALGMIMILIQFYRTKYNLINKDADLNNRKYIETLIDKLKQRMLITSKYMWVYTFLLILGLNIGYVDILKNFDLSILARISIHIIISGVMFFIMYYAIEKRKKKNNNGILPLIEFLENLK